MQYGNKKSAAEALTFCGGFFLLLRLLFGRMELYKQSAKFFLFKIVENAAHFY